MTPLLAAILTGLVIDQTGAVITNATVQYLPERTVKTDTNGRYTTPNLPPGIYSLLLSQPGFQSRRVGPIDLKESLDLGSVDLRIGELPCCDCKEGPPTIIHKLAPSHSSLSGRIRNQLDSSAEVILLPGPLRRPVAEDGTFKFPNLPPGRYSLKIEAPHFGPFEIPRLQVRPRTTHIIEESIDLTLNRSRKVMRPKKTRHPSFCL